MLTSVDLTRDGAPRREGIVDELAESDIPPVSHRLRVSRQRGPRLRMGEPVGVSVEVERLLFFDPTTKVAIG